MTASNLRTFLFVIIIIPAIVTMIAVVLFEGANNYGVDIDDNFTDTYDKINATVYTNYQESKDLQDKFSDPISNEGGEAGVLASLWKIVQTPFNHLSIITTMLTDVAGLLSIPEWIIYTLIAIIITMLGMIILAIGLRTGGA